MVSQIKIHDRILTEIELLQTEDEIKEFLKRILNFELDVADMGKPAYTEEYEKILYEMFF